MLRQYFQIALEALWIREFVRSVPSIALKLSLAALTVLAGLSPALAESTPTFVNPVDYGATFSGGHDDAPAWNKAVAAAEAGKLSIRAPCGKSLLTSPIRITSALTMDGGGAGCTLLVPATSGQAAIEVAGTAEVHLRDLGITCGAANQTGIRIAPASGVNNQGSEISSMRIRSCQIGVDFANAMTWSLHDCIIGAPRLVGAIGIRVANTTNGDAGDSTIHDNVISSGTPAAADSIGILQVSSGGLKLYSNKILGWAYGYALSLSPGVKTSDLLAYNNSVESITIAGFAFSRQKTGEFNNVVLTGNQFANTGTCVKNLSGRGYLSFVGITGNRLGCHTKVSLPGVTSVKLTGNF